MKRLALIAAVFVFTACTAKEPAPAAADTPAMAPAPADTGAKKLDSLAAKMDTGMKMGAAASPAPAAAKPAAKKP